MKILFISDLHLAPHTPHINQLFFNFLEDEQNACQALYILGDLFETWLGDDDNCPFNQQVIKAIAKFSQHTPCYFMHGNRDFLIGEAFTKAANLTILPDLSLIDLFGEQVLLSHGDVFCIDDIDYQRFRTYARNPENQRKFLAKPLWLRRLIARFFRLRSRFANRNKPIEIMDVNADAVAKAMHDAKVNTLIHGHTHRPAIHELNVNGQHKKRIVLAAWHERGNVLICAPDGQFDLVYF